MEVGNRTNRLTRRHESARMGFSAAPRNSALLRLVKSYPFLFFRAIVLIVVVGLVTGAAFAVTTPVQHHKKKKKSSALVAPAAVYGRGARNCQAFVGCQHQATEESLGANVG